VGRLVSLDSGRYEFSYIRAVIEAQQCGFCPLVSFPELNVVYRSAQLPALFSNRVMPKARPDYPEFVTELGLLLDVSPLELMGRSGGRRVTDDLEVFSPPSRGTSGELGQFILVRGVRHVPHAEEAILSLQAGERLLVLRDEQNPHAPHARLLRTDGKELVGYLPDYLAIELNQLGLNSAELTVTVERINPEPSPVSHRVLCRVDFPSDWRLFAGERYQPLAEGATLVAA
jgi:hypothetical protein